MVRSEMEKMLSKELTSVRKDRSKAETQLGNQKVYLLKKMLTQAFCGLWPQGLGATAYLPGFRS